LPEISGDSAPVREMRSLAFPEQSYIGQMVTTVSVEWQRQLSGSIVRLDQDGTKSALLIRIEGQVVI
jgi:hypothetical protein